MAEGISNLQMRIDAPSTVLTAVSLALGTLFTWCLFAGIAHFDRTDPGNPPLQWEDLKTVALPLQPPPPPRTMPPEAEPAPITATVTGFDAAPSDSPVKIAVSPPDLDAHSSAPQVAPPAAIQIGRLFAEFKPKTDLTYEAQHIYQRSEVDQRPTVLFHKLPHIPSWIRGDAKSLSVVLLLVIDTTGDVGDIRVTRTSGNSKFDAIIVGDIKEWGFSPAIRRGRKVRCLVEQPVKVVWTAGSPFEVH
jgi:TonB family protein